MHRLRQKTEFPTIVKLFFNQSQCRRLVALIPRLIHPRFSFVTSFIVVHRKSQMSGNRNTELQLAYLKWSFIFILYIRLRSFSFVIFIFTLFYSSPSVKWKKHFIMCLFEFLHIVQIWQKVKPSLMFYLYLIFRRISLRKLKSR